MQKRREDLNPPCQLMIMINKALIWKFISQTLLKSEWKLCHTHIEPWRGGKKFTVNKEIHSLTPTSAYIYSRCCLYLLLFIYWLSVRESEKKTRFVSVIHTTCRISRSNMCFFCKFYFEDYRTTAKKIHSICVGGSRE